MASPQSEAISDLYRDWVATMHANPEMPLDELRAMFEHWGDLASEPDDVDYEEVDAGGIPAMWATPKGAATDRVLLCTHGGGYVCGSIESHRKAFAHIAKAVGCRALIIDYRRAPEHPHPAQVEDTLASYRWLLDQGIEAKQICTVGDSAGGALCTSVLVAARDAGLPMPACTIPMSPWYDPENVGESVAANEATDILVKLPILNSMAETFLGGASPQDPLANLLKADLAGLPPIYIQVGSYEAMLDNSTRFVPLAKAAGVEVEIDIFPEMQHVFQLMVGRAPEADDAVQRMAEWAKPKLGL